MSDSVGEALVALVCGVIVGVFCLLACTAAVRLAWNAFAPEPFGLPTATSWNSFGIVVLMFTVRMINTEKK